MVKFANRLMGSSKNQTQGYQLVILAMQPSLLWVPIFSLIFRIKTGSLGVSKLKCIACPDFSEKPFLQSRLERA